MKFANIKQELNKVNKKSVTIVKIFSIVSFVVLTIGFFATVIFKNVENGRYLLIMAVTVLTEGIWGGVLIDCMYRRTQ